MSEEINKILSKKEMLNSLEKKVNKHCKDYPRRHEPLIESSFILNEYAIIRLATEYHTMFNENPVIQISSYQNTPISFNIEFKSYDAEIDKELRSLCVELYKGKKE